MIRYLRHSTIDKPKWDQALSRCRNKLIYPSSWYLDTVAPGWEALVNDDHSAIMPLTCSKKYGINYLHQPFFIQQLGIFSGHEITGSEVNEFLDAIPQTYKFIEINLNSSNPYPGDPFSVKKNLNHELKLGAGYETIFRNFSDNAKRNIRKAEGNNLKFIRNCEVDTIIKLFRANRGKEVNTLKAKHYSSLRQLAETSALHKHSNTVGVTNESGKLLAGAIFMETDDRSIFIFSGLDPEGKDKGGMFFLLNEYIRANSEKNMTLDFEGSNNKDLARFYKSFGSEESVYLQVRLNRLPKLVKWLKK